MKKRIFAALLAGTMMLSLCSCGSKTNEDYGEMKQMIADLQQSNAELNRKLDQLTQQLEETAAPTEGAVEAPREYNNRAIVRDGSVDDYLEVREQGTISEGVTYNLPALKLNDEIDSQFRTWVNNIFDEWQGLIGWYREVYSFDEMQLDYSAGVYGDFLTVTMVVNGQTVNGWPYNDSFTVDLTTGKQLTADRFVELSGGTWEKLEDYIRKDIQWMFDNELERYGDLPGLKEMQEKTVSSENLRNSEVVLNAAMRGDIVVHVKLLYYVDESTGKVEAYHTPGIYCAYAENAEEIFG